VYDLVISMTQKGDEQYSKMDWRVHMVNNVTAIRIPSKLHTKLLNIARKFHEIVKILRRLLKINFILGAMARVPKCSILLKI